ncbi:MAG: hypothetical protein AAFY88_01050 [Acidobacteriota bacterium]
MKKTLTIACALIVLAVPVSAAVPASAADLEAVAIPSLDGTVADGNLNLDADGGLLRRRPSLLRLLPERPR